MTVLTTAAHDFDDHAWRYSAPQRVIYTPIMLTTMLQGRHSPLVSAKQRASHEQ